MEHCSWLHTLPFCLSIWSRCWGFSLNLQTDSTFLACLYSFTLSSRLWLMIPDPLLLIQSYQLWLDPWRVFNWFCTGKAKKRVQRILHCWYLHTIAWDLECWLHIFSFCKYIRIVQHINKHVQVSVCSTVNEAESQEKEWHVNRNADESQLSFSEQNVTKHTVASSPCVHTFSSVVRAFKGWTAAHVSVFLLSHSLKPVLTAHAEIATGSLDSLYQESTSALEPLTHDQIHTLISSCSRMYSLEWACRYFYFRIVIQKKLTHF